MKKTVSLLIATVGLAAAAFSNAYAAGNEMIFCLSQNTWVKNYLK